MITSAQVCRMFDKWEYSGLKPPIEKISEGSKLVTTFVERFRFMDEATLEHISVRILSGNVWPTFGVIEQMARDFQESNRTYEYIDYFKELSKKAYLQDESFEGFIQRVAEQHFPGRGKEWVEKYGFQIHFYGICVAACKGCEGVCPHHGHQYHLRIKRGTDVPIPWASMDVCDKYKYVVDGEGNRRGRPKGDKQECFEPLDTGGLPEAEMPDLGFDPFSVENERGAKNMNNSKYEQQSLL